MHWPQKKFIHIYLQSFWLTEHRAKMMATVVVSTMFIQIANIPRTFTQNDAICILVVLCCYCITNHQTSLFKVFCPNIYQSTICKHCTFHHIAYVWTHQMFELSATKQILIRVSFRFVSNSIGFLFDNFM